MLLFIAERQRGSALRGIAVHLPHHEPFAVEAVPMLIAAATPPTGLNGVVGRNGHAPTSIIAEEGPECSIAGVSLSRSVPSPSAQIRHSLVLQDAKGAPPQGV